MATEAEPAILPSMSANRTFGATPEASAFEFSSPATVRSLAASDRLGLLGLVGLLITGLVICISAAGTDTLLPEFPGTGPGGYMAGPFSSGGLYLPSGAVVGVLSLMFVSYVLVVRAAGRISPRVVLMTIAGLIALVLLAPPLFSLDVFSYQAYARMWVTHGTNPYVHGPFAIQLDPVYQYIGAKWINTPSVYGPLFTMLSGVLATASIATSAVAFKALGAVACLGTIALIWHSCRLRGLDPVRGVALFALNPLVFLYGIGGGHNDLLMLLFTTAAIYAVLSRRERSGGALLAIGTAIKLTGGLVLPFALASGVELGASRRRRAITTAFVLTTAIVTVAGVALYGDWPVNLLRTLDTVQGEGDWHSIPGFITTALGFGQIGHIAGYVLGAVFLGIFLWLLRRVWRGQMDWIDGAAWTTVAILVSAGSILPWYVAWLLPLVALCTDRRLWKVSLWLTGVIMLTTMLGYIPHGTSIFGLGLVP